MQKYRVTLDIDNKQFARILAGLNRMIDEDSKVIGEFSHLATDNVVSKHLHELVELREYIRERYFEAKEVPDDRPET